jgi:hypothetical protein
MAPFHRHHRAGIGRRTTPLIALLATVLLAAGGLAAAPPNAAPAHAADANPALRIATLPNYTIDVCVVEGIGKCAGKDNNQRHDTIVAGGADLTYDDLTPGVYMITATFRDPFSGLARAYDAVIVQVTGDKTTAVTLTPRPYGSGGGLNWGDPAVTTGGDNTLGGTMTATPHATVGAGESPTYQYFWMTGTTSFTLLGTGPAYTIPADATFASARVLILAFTSQGSGWATIATAIAPNRIRLRQNATDIRTLELSPGDQGSSDGLTKTTVTWYRGSHRVRKVTAKGFGATERTVTARDADSLMHAVVTLTYRDFPARTYTTNTIRVGKLVPIVKAAYTTFSEKLGWTRGYKCDPDYDPDGFDDPRFHTTNQVRIKVSGTGYRTPVGRLTVKWESGGTTHYRLRASDHGRITVTAPTRFAKATYCDETGTIRVTFHNTKPTKRHVLAHATTRRVAIENTNF